MTFNGLSVQEYKDLPAYFGATDFNRPDASCKIVCYQYELKSLAIKNKTVTIQAGLEYDLGNDTFKKYLRTVE